MFDLAVVTPKKNTLKMYSSAAMWKNYYVTLIFPSQLSNRIDLTKEFFPWYFLIVIVVIVVIYNNMFILFMFILLFKGDGVRLMPANG